MARKKIGSSVERDVLIKSRRRCCLCFGLNFDTSYKKIQIAHLDRDASNNSFDNLAALCQVHHDEYDSIPRQTKRLTLQEVKHYRDQLYSAFEKREEQLVLSLSPIPPLKKDRATPSANLLGRVLDAFDKEYQGILSDTKSANGIALARLARIALEDEGDFDVVVEAFLSLIRIATAMATHYDTKTGTNKSTGLVNVTESIAPSATPYKAIQDVLKHILLTDSSLSTHILRKMHIHSLAGDSGFIALDDYTFVPNASVNVIAPILAAISISEDRHQYSWAMEDIVGCLVDILFGLALSLSVSGVGLPQAPKRIVMTVNYKRWIEPGYPEEWLQFIQIASEVARLPPEEFRYALSHRFNMGIWHIGIDENGGMAKEHGLLALKRWALVPNRLIMVVDFNGKTHNDAAALQLALEQHQEMGEEIMIGLREYLLSERSLITQRKMS